MSSAMKLSVRIIGLSAMLVTASFYQHLPAAEPKAPNAVRTIRKLPPECEKALTDADQQTQQYFTRIELHFQQFFQSIRTKENLRFFVGDLLSYMEKFQMGADLLANKSDSEKRIRVLFCQKVLDDDVFTKVAGDCVEDFSRFLTNQDAALLVRLKVDRDISAKQLSRSDFDATKFRAQIASVVQTAVSAAQTDVARFAANLAVSEVLATGVKVVGRDVGLLPKDKNSWESFFGSLLLDVAVNAAVDQVTDPTEKIVEKLQQQLTAAEKAMLDGTDKQPGLLRVLRQAAAERNAARRHVLVDHFSK